TPGVMETSGVLSFYLAVPDSDKVFPGALLPFLPGNRKEGVGDLRVELGTAEFFHLTDDGIEGERLTVGSVGGHGIQRIHQPEDTRPDRYLFPLHVVGITVAV